jgi:hypothetical protein
VSRDSFVVAVLQRNDLNVHIWQGIRHSRGQGELTVKKLKLAGKLSLSSEHLLRSAQKGFVRFAGFVRGIAGSSLGRVPFRAMRGTRCSHDPVGPTQGNVFRFVRLRLEQKELLDSILMGED